MKKNKIPEPISGELAELRQRTAKAEEALRQALRREQAMGRIRDRILETRHGTHLFPQMIDYWLEELRDLGIPLHELSLQRPSTRPGYFLEYIPPETVQRRLADYPWIQEVQDSGKPVVVEGEHLESKHYPEEVQCLLEVPLPGEEFLSVSSTVPDAFDDETIRVIQIFTGLFAEGLQRLKDFEARNESEDRLRLALKAANIAGWEWDLRNREIVWSENFETLMGLDSDTFKGSSGAFLEYVHCEDRERVVRSISRTLEQDADYDIEFRLVRFDQIVRRVRAQGRIFFDSRGEAIRMIGVVMDLTQYKQLEDQLRQAQKLEAVGTLAGGIAHDFNNLLTVILGNCDLLLEEATPTDPRYRDLEEIKNAGERASLMTHQLLAFSRKEVAQLKILDLNAVIASIDKILKRLIGDDIEVGIAYGEGLGKVKVDPGQVEQIIMNLSVNARDAMPQGGKLTIETARVDLDHAYARWRLDIPSGSYMRLTVSDTGCGMNQETLSHIFEPFFTTKGPDRGTGLGLSTIYGIVEQSGGAIEVDSSPGEGTTFKVYLPETEEMGEDVEGELSFSESPRGMETILLVEDNEQVRNLTNHILSQKGYTLLVAANGEEALQICDQHKGPIHLLVTDVVMPGMSGPELVQHLRSRRQQTEVLCISGNRDKAFASGLQADMAFLQKPFSPAVLALKVRELLDVSPQERE